MALFDDLPDAPDGRPYWLATRFASLYSWGRPPIPGEAADLLAALACKYQVKGALVLGSCCPSVLTALSFGDPERQIRMVDMKSRWWEGYGFFLEDVSDPDRYPRYESWLPSKRIYAMSEWSWSPRLGEMIFVDLPGSSNLVNVELDRVLRAVRPRLVTLGFMQGRPGPDDLESVLREHDWTISEAAFRAVNHETGESMHYRLVAAAPSLDDSSKSDPKGDNSDATAE